MPYPSLHVMPCKLFVKLRMESHKVVIRSGSNATYKSGGASGWSLSLLVYKKIIKTDIVKQMNHQTDLDLRVDI